MARYVYQAEDGEQFEVEASMQNPPPAGHVKVRGGKRFVRQISVPGGTKVSPEIHFESHSLPLFWKYAKDHNPKTGKPRFQSMRAVREAEARGLHAGERIVYD